jgi:hypothetical protein
MEKLQNFFSLTAMSTLALGLCLGSLQAQDVKEAAVSSLFVDSTAALSTSSQAAVAVPGIIFNLPAETSSNKFAIVTLSMPNLYLNGTPTSGSLGGQVSVVLSGVTTLATANISNDVGGMGAAGRKNVTIQVKISLLPGLQSVQAFWNGVRGATINTDTYSSMSAILTGN